MGARRKNPAKSKATQEASETTDEPVKEQQVKITDQFKASKSKTKKSSGAKGAKNGTNAKSGTDAGDDNQKGEKKEKKPKKVVDRFGGMPESEVAKRKLPDYLQEGLDIVFIGINPSMWAAYTGKYYDGPGNHFWRALYLSGFLPSPMGPGDETTLLETHGIGFTNIVERCVHTTYLGATLKR